MKKQDIPTHLLQDLHPLEFKVERIDHVNRYNPFHVHRHDYFEVFVFVEGGGFHLIDFEQLPILCGQVHFVRPGQVHQVQRAPGSSGFVLLFSEDFYHSNRERSDFLFQRPFFSQKTENAALALAPEELLECTQTIGHMMGVYEGKSRQKKSILQSYLHIFLCHCLDCFERQAPATASHPSGLSIFQRFQVAVEKNFASVHEVMDYAQKLSVSPRQINELCQKHAGRSAVEFIHRRIALEAKRLLCYSEASISEIGFHLGFEDPAHFSRFVKKCTGHPPSEWRKTALRTN